MDLHKEFEAAHEEHADILDFLNIWEGALNLIACDDCDTRCTGLRQLQAMEGKIVEIWEHCHKEENDPESPLFRFATPAERERMKEEHFRLYRAHYEFRREMEFTTSSFTDDLVIQGRRLLAALREHIAFEEELLHKIMIAIHKNCFETAAEYGTPWNLVNGANIAGFLKVANAMLDQGLV